ncbi:hypothetical protein DAPPUDRAFT_257643 [Daphnia pulex]|uniref:PHD-type domain-containing protein n=1 Tax=Daphnia pulex TaxID=6669 RepID=E9HDY9_DAPPU|nr:hypothetical protein DAPPUDRAFT_257643 [Daphnia pulex]|eukprot:EFX70008.1 hypothetical protein DAPPUDRAFT_257643 [Daphnia pulex]
MANSSMEAKKRVCDIRAPPYGPRHTGLGPYVIDCLHNSRKLLLIMDCCICEISITGRKPQIIECVSCRGFMHRQCMQTSLSSTDYVRMKKDKEVFNYKCVKCVGGIIVSAEPHQPRKHPLPATLPEPEPEVRPTFLAIAAASMPDTSSPMNIDGPRLLPFGVSPIDALPVTITVEARVAVTFTITPVGDASSRFEVPVPVSEDTVELLQHQPIAIQDDDNRDDDLESSDDDEPVWHIKEKAMKNERKTLFDGVGHSYHVKRNNKRSVAWRCNKHTNPNFCRSWVSQCDANFTLRVPHTVPTNLDISRDASILMKAKAQAISNTLASARAVLEKEMMLEFAKDPSRNLPVKNNLIRAVQRKKQPKFPKNPTDLHFDWDQYGSCIPDGYFRRDIITVGRGWSYWDVL